MFAEMCHCCGALLPSVVIKMILSIFYRSFYESLMKKFLVLFFLLLITLFVAELTPPVQKFFVQPFTALLATISISVIHLFDDNVMSYGVIIYNTVNQFAVSIEAGCNGIEASIILFSAIMTFPRSWKARLLGVTIGLVSLHAVNIVRIISLFYLGQWNMTAFEWAHLYLWQALIMLDVFIVFLIWLKFAPDRPKMECVDTAAS